MAQQIVQAACPGCRHVLHIPAAWLGQMLKCKHCGVMFQAKVAPTSAATVPGATFSSLDNVAGSKARRRRPPWRAAWWAAPALFLGTFCLAAPLLGAVWSYIRPRPDVERYLAGDAEERELFVKHDASPSASSSSSSASSPSSSSSVRLSTPVSSSSASSVASRSPSGSSPPASSSSSSVKPPPPEPRSYPNRRALVVGIHNYLIFNTTLSGPTNQASRYQLLADRLSSTMMIPRPNITLLSDAISGQGARPVRPVLIDAFTDFTSTARAQDCLFVYFTGHVVELGEPAEAYLAPLDGELEAVESLIPLKWLFGKLEQSPARQKVLVLDVCRYNAERGLQRRASNAADPKTEGAMWEELAKKLSEPPAGVQVWLACGPDQFSHEIEEGFHNGIFIEGLIDALGNNAAQKPQTPDDPIPVDRLIDAVNAFMKRELDKRKQVQVSRLSGQPREGGTTYDPKEAAPPALTIRPQPVAGGVMKPADLTKLIDEIQLPPVNLSAGVLEGIRLETLPPFDAIRMDDYREDKDKDAEVRAFVMARHKLLFDEITKHGVQEEFRAPADEAQFKGTLVEIQKVIAVTIRKLETAATEMQGAMELRGKASRRWQANFDYVQARLEQRIAFLYEYTSQLGQMKSGLPERDAKIQDGWCLVSVARLQGDKSGKDMKKAADKLLAKMADDYRGTPWEILAKRHHADCLGLDTVATHVRNR
jgi:hypothetical protein